MKLDVHEDGFPTCSSRVSVSKVSKPSESLDEFWSIIEDDDDILYHNKKNIIKRKTITTEDIMNTRKYDPPHEKIKNALEDATSYISEITDPKKSRNFGNTSTGGDVGDIGDIDYNEIQKNVEGALEKTSEAFISFWDKSCKSLLI
eukprot:CAMPEP_0194275828 /NCGR_PEP_ID=MMETSP0169-20130528/8574_1 /TAXON_ID=218684 /ORGANISM="Corethron pennatum, Strain L29A3" /LENGTH=145 /DNA_ID=CAMNT_0039019393 /DNA_START=69 /DNA_END=506 /DNA_ORIENTATION=-